MSDASCFGHLTISFHPFALNIDKGGKSDLGLGELDAVECHSVENGFTALSAERSDARCQLFTIILHGHYFEFSCWNTSQAASLRERERLSGIRFRRLAGHYFTQGSHCPWFEGLAYAGLSVAFSRWMYISALLMAWIDWLRLRPWRLPMLALRADSDFP